MEYILSGLFGQVFSKYGLLGALVAVAAFIGLVLLAKLAAVKIEGVRDAARDQKDALAQANARADGAQSQLHVFMTNHLEHDRAEREAMTKVMTETSATLKAIADDLHDHREEEGGRAAKFHEKLDAIRLSIAERKA